MVLNEKVLGLIRDKEIRRELGRALNNVVDQVILNYIRKNKPNGPLTTWKALQVIRAKTGLTDTEILVDEEDMVAST
jgi:hypothetical protein